MVLDHEEEVHPLPISHSENITRKFYRHFKKVYEEFLSCIQGISDQSDRERYAFLTLNRLLFLAFMQQKGFLASDKNYLSNHLRQIQKKPQQKPSYSFYQCFLLKLFHEGLNIDEHSSETTQLLGKVPYLNSSLFATHMLERNYPDIQIPDSAFERLLDFLHMYHWSLDDQDSYVDEKRHKKITPDMLGNIFEQFINQKEKGAYYTKKDVTHYISKNTIIPALFQATEKRCPNAFSHSGPIWSLFDKHPNHYINEEVQAKLRARGIMVETSIHDINDFITYNLDSNKFAWDVIAACEKPELLLAFYESIETITILDPTCGSGAFLFAALDILYPLYNVCLSRIHKMLNEYEQIDAHIGRFQNILRQAHIKEKEPFFQDHRLKYFITKSIITKNLYGVDLMEEAVEICKIHLLLKLIAQVDRPEDIEPLPDSSFNIFVGNALVDSSNLDETIADSLKSFHWYTELHDVMKEGGFSVIIGNPPYVEYNALKFPYTLHHFKTFACGNLYPCIVERSRQLLSLEGYQGMILPLAAFATKNMVPFIDGFYEWFPQSWISFYHFRPSMLFSGDKVASIPTAIFLAKATGPEQRFSTNLRKWPTDQRDQLFSQLLYCPITTARDSENKHYYPKFGHPIENTIMEKIVRHQRIETFLRTPVPKRGTAKTSDPNTMWYRSAGGLYWKVFVNFSWPYETTSNKQSSFQSQYERDVFVALFNSSVFWWYYTVTFDTFNLKDYMIFGFRFSYPEDTDLIDSLRLCCKRLMDDFRANAQHLKRGTTDSYTVYARKSKHIIDDIDRILARHYGFTDEELDFIIRYDIKYRMGNESEG